MAQAQALPPEVDAALLRQYRQRVERGEIQDDAAQREILAVLQRLCDALGVAPQGGLLSRLFGKAAPAPRGCYIWGNVGRGKSMLMDLFFAQAPVEKKRRIHFHAFMQEMHGRMHALRQQGRDPVTTLAAELAQETRLLCFDELQATDPADATVLLRLFTGLFAAGVVVVSTSNRPPESLYTGDVQAERFTPFIALIEERMQVLALSSATDYRHAQRASMKRVFFHPLGKEADAFVAQSIHHLCGEARPRRDEFVVQGRHLPFTLYAPDIGVFSFRELCAQALGPADYLAIAKRLDTVVLTGIPRLTPEMRNEAKRFVTLIDALYEQKVLLIATAAAAPEQLYTEGHGSFEFARTVSRLAEMQSEKYINQSFQ